MSETAGQRPPKPHPLDPMKPTLEMNAMSSGKDVLTVGTLIRVLKGVPEHALVSVWQPEDALPGEALWQVKATWDNLQGRDYRP